MSINPNYFSNLTLRTLLLSDVLCRSCTDIPCCILFVAYIVGMVVVGIIGKHGVEKFSVLLLEL